MTPEAEQHFHATADLTPSERAAYFEANAVEAALRQEVESLLDNDGPLSLEESLASAAHATIIGLPQRCGPYELRELIGSGGMGMVYRAERTDGEVKQQAAVKLLHPTFHDASIRDRFLRERQILAQISHPNIARLIDAGHTADNRPYLVMEYVEGKRIDDFCRGISLNQRLGLFLKVCDAVSFLHSNLVVHRDLKPGNILVTAEGEPKLLDFGIAMILDLDSQRTLTRDQALTPEYASPEQLCGASINTASDIYSLGAVLYKLLTDQLPRQTRGSDILLPSKWDKELQGDLDAILMKALRVEPHERYSSAERMAEDIHAYLDLRPVAARRGTLVYRSRKFLRRYWMAASAAAMLLFATVAGTVFVQGERAVAEKRFREVRSLAAKLFELDSEVASLAGSVKARQLIVSTSLTYLERLSGEAGDDFDLILELAQAYITTAKVQFARGIPSLGQEEESRRSYESAIALLERAIKLRPGDPAPRRLLAESLGILSAIHSGQAADSGVAKALRAVESVEALVGPNSSAEDYALASRAYRRLSVAYMQNRKIDLAQRYSELALKTQERVAQMNGRPADRVDLAARRRSHGDVLRYAGQLEPALAEFDKALTVIAAIGPPDSEGPAVKTEVANILYSKGLVLGDTSGPSLGRYKDAVEPLMRSRDVAEAMIQADEQDANARLDYTQASLKIGRALQDDKPEEALAVYDDGLKVAGGMPESSARRLTYSVRLLCESVLPLVRLHRADEVERRLSLAISLLKKAKHYPPAKISLTSPGEAFLRAKAEREANAGRLREAVAGYETVLRLMDPKQVAVREDLSDALGLTGLQGRLRELLLSTGDQAGADRLAREISELWEYWDRKLPGNPLVRRELGRSAQWSGKNRY